MEVYLSYLAFVCVQYWIINKLNFDILEIKSLKINKKLLFVSLACLELIIISGLRAYDVGADTFVYLKALDYYKTYSFPEVLFVSPIRIFDFETGYLLLTKLCATLNVNKTVFLFMIASLINVPIFYIIYKKSKYPLLSIFTYFGLGLFSYSLGIFRQMIACSILVLGIRFIEDRKFIKFLGIVILASLFHKTAIICLPLYFIYKIDSKILLICTAIIEIPLIFFGKNIIELIFKLAPSYKFYLNTTYNISGGSYLMLLLLVMLLVFCVFAKNEKDKQMFITFLTTGILVQTLGYQMNLFGRLMIYFLTYIIIIIPNIACLYLFDKKYRKVIMLALILLFLLLTIKNMYNNIYITPYKLFI